jgi:hypothetical protein
VNRELTQMDKNKTAFDLIPLRVHSRPFAVFESHGPTLYRAAVGYFQKMSFASIRGFLKVVTGG